MKFVLVLIAVIGMTMADEKQIEKDLKTLYKALDDFNKETKGVSKDDFVKYFMQFDDTAHGGDGDGKLEKGELTKGLTLSAEVEEALWEEFNNNNDDHISKAELEKDYDEFDTNDDNNLTEAELIEAIVLGMIYEEMDTFNGAPNDDKVKETEFVEYFMKAEKLADQEPGVSEADLLKYLEKYPEVVVKKLFNELEEENDNDKVISREELKLNYKAFNADNNDHLTVEEFRNGVSNGPVGQIFAKLGGLEGDFELTAEEIVAKLNHDNKGATTKDDAKKALEGILPQKLVDNFIAALNTDANENEISKDEVQKFIDKHDTIKKNGKLNWSEFEKAVAPLAA